MKKKVSFNKILKCVYESFYDRPAINIYTKFLSHYLNKLHFRICYVHHSIVFHMPRFLFILVAAFTLKAFRLINAPKKEAFLYTIYLYSLLGVDLLLH